MLVLKRYVDQSLTIAGVIHVRVLAIKGERVVLGLEAPRHVSIVRSELLEQQTSPAKDLEAPSANASSLPA